MKTQVRESRRLLLAAALLFVGCSDAASQNAPQGVHPSKQIYADAEQWPATAPGEVSLANFQPFRAVYERHYRDVNGEHRQDRVIVTAEEVAWGTEAAILVGLVDAGSLEYDDTSARNQFRFFSRDDLRLLLQVTPAPGTAKDYAVIRADAARVGVTTVRTESGEAEHRDVPVPGPGFGAPAQWILGSMSLTPDQKVRLFPEYGQGSSRVFNAAPFRVIGQEEVEDGLGIRHDAWIVEHPLGMTSPRVMRTQVIGRPPYLLGRSPLDNETGETTQIGSMRLIELEVFPR
ncbi:MAG: hypothetical protein OEU54_01650 [Gemmatimonadota bacterium]|nr:hypothetical protein [Gemmatimonadota bacterium]